MKPCRKNRKPIVWLVMEALEEPAATALSVHLETCEGCRGYRDEILSVTQQVRSIETLAQPSLDYAYRKSPVQRPAARRSSSFTLIRDGLRTSAGRRFAVPLFCAFAIIVFLVAVYVRHPADSHSFAQLQVTKLPNPPTDLSPSIANYHTIANESLDQFDDLLTRQAKHASPPPKPFTVGTLAQLDGLD
jgi:hypothetical protein